MPIILAIEPDRRQRQALGAVVHHRVGAELILADTTEHALEAIGNRMPDLVLVPALLSPQDDAALAAALRVIAAAAHVRTLTIPVLASESRSEAPSGLLSRWRRGRNASQAPDGCDPVVFAEQISAYLAEAAAERAALNEDADHIVDEIADAPVVETSFVEAPFVEPPRVEAPVVDAATLHAAIANAVSAERPSVERAVANYVSADHGFVDHSFVDHTIVDHAVVDHAVADRTFVVDTPLLAHEEPALVVPDAPIEPILAVHEVRDEDEDKNSDAQHDDDFDAEEDIDLSNELADISVDDGEETELFDGEPVGVYTMPGFGESDVVDVPIVAAFAAPAPVPAERVVEEAIVEEFAVEDLAAEELVVAEFAVEEVAVEEPAAAPQVLEARAAFEQAEVLALADADAAVLTEFAEYAEPEPDSADADAWISASLTRPCPWPALEGVPAEIVIEPVRPEPARPAAPAAAHVREREWTELVASLRKDIERRRVEPPVATEPKRQTNKAKPVQDEWGFFDPEQCGFAALLAKLDEITDAPEERDAPRH